MSSEEPNKILSFFKKKKTYSYRYNHSSLNYMLFIVVFHEFLLKISTTSPFVIIMRNKNLCNFFFTSFKMSILSNSRIKITDKIPKFKKCHS